VQRVQLAKAVSKLARHIMHWPSILTA